MKAIVLASGSEGNVTYIQTENHKILFDLGMNVKYIKEKLREIEVLPEDIDYIVISHTHNDHVGALKNFIKKYQPTICMTKSMFKDLNNIKDYEHIIIYDEDITLSDVKIDTIKTSHDTDDSRGFIISDSKDSIVLITDTGYINQKNFPKLQNKTAYLIESNHDPEKLLNGPYPFWLKKRIQSDYGHLSNRKTSIYMTRLIGENTKHIVLMHLSQKNNTEELALNTMKETFEMYNVEFDNIVCAKQKESVEVEL